MHDCFTEILNKKNLISNCNLDKKNKKLLYNYLNLCNVIFSDDKLCEKIIDFLKNIKKSLNQIYNDYNFIFEIFTKCINILEINTKYSSKILKNDYELKNLSEKILIDDNLANFSEIKKKKIIFYPSQSLMLILKLEKFFALIMK